MKSTSWEKSARWYKTVVGQKGHYFHQHVILPALLDMMKLKSKESLLDIGCGQGILARSIPSDIVYTGVDMSEALVNEARRLDSNPQHVYLTLDASLPMPLSHGAFDKVALVLALQNIKNWDGVIRNIATLLKPGGKAYFVINHPYFRIPRQTGWMIDETSKLQKRWVNRYMSPLDIPVKTHPSRPNSPLTWSFHRPFFQLFKILKRNSFVVSDMDELVSDKESAGVMRKSENRSRLEIPLFMLLEVIKPTAVGVRE